MLSLHEIFLRLGFAALLGAVIGIEREVHRRPAGMRTSAFVCMGSALFTILSFELAKMTGDTSGTRIASNLVQGIGFLGAGAILRDAGGLVGLTTAATIFVEAAIGMAVGGGVYAVAGGATGVGLVGVVWPGWRARVGDREARVIGFWMSAAHVLQCLRRLRREARRRLRLASRSCGVWGLQRNCRWRSSLRGILRQMLRHGARSF